MDEACKDCVSVETGDMRNGSQRLVRARCPGGMIECQALDSQLIHRAVPHFVQTTYKDVNVDRTIAVREEGQWRPTHYSAQQGAGGMCKAKKACVHVTTHFYQGQNKVNQEHNQLNPSNFSRDGVSPFLTFLSCQWSTLLNPSPSKKPDKRGNDPAPQC